MRSGKLLLGVLAGAAAGATMGILFAPEKGSKTRRQIVDRKDKYVDDLKDKMDGFFKGITEKFENAKQETEGFVANSKRKFAEAKREVENGNSGNI